jgi:serine/threonine protein kinase
VTSPVDTIIAGKYQVKRRLGQGGMGAVYEGVHLEIGKRVAIKVIDPSHAGSAEIAARFKREARAASAVESDCVVQVFDVGHDPIVGLYMVMEYLTGEDLAARIERDKKLDPALAVQIITQAARALAKAHAAGVVHRDLKPANLFLTEREDGSILVKVLDFGISKLIGDTGSAPTGGPPRALTRAGTVIGTAQYMSPEQAQGLSIDHRTDIWSLGAVLYEALAGRSAYPEMATYEQTIIQIVTKQPTPLREVAPWVGEGLAKLVHEAMTPEPDRRLSDCGSFARRLVELAPEAGARPSNVGLPGGSPIVVRPPGSDLGFTSPSPSMQLGATSASGPHPVPAKHGTDEGVAVGSFIKPRPSARLVAGLGLLGAALVGVAIVGVRALRHVEPSPQGIVESNVSLPATPSASPVAAGSSAVDPSPPPAASTPEPAPSSVPAPSATTSAPPKVTQRPHSGPSKSQPTVKTEPSAEPKTIGGAGIVPTY